MSPSREVKNKGTSVNQMCPYSFACSRRSFAISKPFLKWCSSGVVGDEVCEKNA